MHICRSVVKTYETRIGGIWDIFLGVRLNGVLAPTFHLRAPSPTFVGPIPKRGRFCPSFSFERFILFHSVWIPSASWRRVAYLGMVLQSPGPLRA
jgi:hypothetical protein